MGFNWGIKETYKEFKTKENWKNLRENPIMENLIGILIIFIILLIIPTTYVTFTYFYRNEILFGISDKYVTTEEDSIKDTIDTTHIFNEFNQNLKGKSIIKINDSTTIYLSNNFPIKHRIEKKEKESFELGDIGDFIGGYFGFLIGVIGALLTFLAFYIQYKANKDVQKQFRLQQFETQFHKMIDVYLNNKDKFSIIGYKNPKNKPIDLLQLEADNLTKKLNILNDFYSNQNINFIEFTTKDHIVFQKFLVELKVIYRVFLEAYKEEFSITEEYLDKNIKIKESLFIEAYRLFFNGLNQYCKKNKIELDEKNNLELQNHKYFDIEHSILNLYEKFITRIEFFNENLVDRTIPTILKSEVDREVNTEINTEIKHTALLLLDNLRNIHKKTGSKIYKNFYNDGTKYKNLWLKLNYTPFQGYLHFLPQYYRNLYSIVKYVVTDNSDLNLSTNEKSKYLRILRSTMSEHEQTLLFYNWLSGTGIEWENAENKFFSNWKMIDNLNDLTLIDKDFKFENYLKKSN